MSLALYLTRACLTGWGHGMHPAWPSLPRGSGGLFGAAKARSRMSVVKLPRALV